jgi:hypothetical protein
MANPPHTVLMSSKAFAHGPQAAQVTTLGALVPTLTTTTTNTFIKFDSIIQGESFGDSAISYNDSIGVFTNTYSQPVVLLVGYSFAFDSAVNGNGAVVLISKNTVVGAPTPVRTIFGAAGTSGLPANPVVCGSAVITVAPGDSFGVVAVADAAAKVGTGAAGAPTGIPTEIQIVGLKTIAMGYF